MKEVSKETSELLSDICKSSWEFEQIPYHREASNITPLFLKRIKREALLPEISNFNTDSVQNSKSYGNWRTPRKDCTETVNMVFH